MRMGQSREPDAVDAVGPPFDGSRHARGPNAQGNQVDLGKTSLRPVKRYIVGIIRDRVKGSKAYEAYRTLTAPGRVLPDFLIIGAMRGGTTSLYRYLVQHPCILHAFTKEVEYFSQTHNFKRGVNWYKGHFPKASQVAKLQTKAPAKVITGEGTPVSVAAPLAPRRIAELLPQIKAIMLIRNPVDRAYSHHQHEVRMGREHRSFEEALNVEAALLCNEEAQTAQICNNNGEKSLRYSYQELGLYIDQIERWESFFPTENLLVLQSEHLFDHPVQTLNEAFEFLNVPKLELPFYKCFNHASKPDIDPAVRSRLFEYFEPYNRRLYRHLGRDLGWEKGR